MAQPVGPLVISIFFMLEAILVKPQIFALYAQTWHGFFMGMLAFLFGYLMMYGGRSFWKTITRYKWIYLLLASALYIFRCTQFNFEAPGYLMALESTCWIFAIFGLVHQYLNRPSALLSYLSEAAYPVYILHMSVLFLGCLLILPMALETYMKFLLIVLFTFVGCYLLYEIIKRISFVRPLFGLKIQQRTTDKTLISGNLVQSKSK